MEGPRGSEQRPQPSGPVSQAEGGTSATAMALGSTMGLGAPVGPGAEGAGAAGFVHSAPELTSMFCEALEVIKGYGGQAKRKKQVSVHEPQGYGLRLPFKLWTWASCGYSMANSTD